MSLGQTFSLLLVILVLAFCMAASTITQLQLSSRMAERGQADGLARAALNEFILHAQQTAPPLDLGSVAPALLDRFVGQETLLQPSPRLPGTATLLPAQCTDNLQNSLAVTGRFENQVPPYSFSAVYRVSVSGL